MTRSQTTPVNADDKSRDELSKNPSQERSAVVPEAEQGGGWRPMTMRPSPRSRIVTLYDDGSGARIYYATDDGQLVDGEDGCTYDWEDRDNQSLWAYLPDSYRFWVENDAVEPMTLPPAKNSAGDNCASEASQSALSVHDEQLILSQALARVGEQREAFAKLVWKAIDYCSDDGLPDEPTADFAGAWNASFRAADQILALLTLSQSHSRDEEEG